VSLAARLDLVFANKITLAIAVAAGLSSAGISVPGKAQDLTEPARSRSLTYRQPRKPIVFVQAPTAGNVVNQALNDAAAGFENIARLAINGKTDAIANEILAIDTASRKVKEFGPRQTFRDLADRLSEIKAAQTSADFEGGNSSGGGLPYHTVGARPGDASDAGRSLFAKIYRSEDAGAGFRGFP